MPIFNVPGRGRVQLPEGLKPEDYQAILRGMQMEMGVAPEYSFGQIAGRPVQRTLENIGTSITKELPAMGLSALGYEDKAREFLQEAKQEYAERAERLPRMYQSYEDVTGPLSALGFAYERAGEALPYGLAMLLPGGAAAAGARGIAARAGTAATEAALARGLPAAAAESLGAARATQVMQRAGLGGAGVGGYALNAPETFAKVAEETGELRPGVAATAAIGQTLLDLVAPSAFLSKLGMFGKLKASEEVAKRAGFTEAAKDLAIAAAKTAPKEGLTEAAQEVIGNAAVDFVRGSGDLFSPERIKQYIEAGLSGAVGGGALGAAGRGIQRIGMPVEQPAPAQQAAVTEPQVTQPVVDDTLLKYQIPPAGGITPDIVTDQALTPQPSSVGYQVPPETFTETPVDQKYFEQFVADIMAGVPRQAPEDQQFYANNAPAIEQRLREAQAAPALPAPTPQETGELSIPVPQAEVLQLAAPDQVAAEQVVEEGPPEFVEPPPMEGPAPLSEEDQRITDEIAQLEKQAAELATQKEAVEARERKRKTQGDTFLNALKKAGVSAKDVADIRKTQSDKNLDKAVVSGLLDPWLGEFSSVAVDRADVFDQKMKQNEAVEYLKDRILNFDYVSDTTKAELADLDLKLDEVLTMIREFRSELEANLKAAEAADEQRVVYEQVEQAIPESEERVTELGEAARPEREAARAEVAFTPQSYAEQMMEGTLPDTDEAYAYFQENQQEIEQALADLEERRAQPMMKATAAQKSMANQLAKIYSGSVVWQDGDISLIQAYSSLTGDPVYIVSKGDYTLGADVESDRVTYITPQQKSQLIAVKNSLEKKAKDLHDKSPYIQFGADGLVFSQTVPKELKGIVEGWKKLLKIQANIYVTNKDDIAANVNKFTGPHRAIGSDLNAGKDNIGSMRKMADGNYYIIFSKDVSNLRMMETLAHELGHIHERETYKNADVATQRAVRDEFDKFLASRKGSSAREYIGKMRARAGFKTLEIPEGLQAERLNPYWFKFSEWYADQVSRWATTSEKPLTVVERFFKRLADALKSFYARVRNQKYLPNETFKQYMDKVTASVKDIAPVRVEAKPLGVKDQMALFMRAAMSQFDTPEFKRWFGDSKVVNDRGAPKVMYHGTDAANDFDAFDTSRGGAWFAEDPYIAEAYTRRAGGGAKRLIPTYLSIQNPVRVPEDIDLSKEYSAEEVVNRINDVNGTAFLPEDFRLDPEQSAPAYQFLASKDLADFAAKSGFDGVNAYEGGYATWSAFEPSQIKSVYNVGTFDPSTDEIQYMRRSVEGLTDAGKDLSPQEQQDLFNAVDKIDDTPAEGMKSMDTMIKDTPSFEATKAKLGQYVKDATADNAQTLLQFLNLRQIAELAKKDLPQVRQYYDVLNQMLVERDKKLTTASKLREKWDQWADKNPKLGEALDKVILDARMSGIDPTIPEKEAKIKSESFRKNWEMIKGTEGETIFKELRDFYKTQLNDKREILKRIITTKITDVNERAKSLRELDFEFQKFESEGPYFPLSRFGQYFIAYNIKLPNGETKPYQEMFESLADLRKHEESIAKDVASGKIINLKSGVDTKELFTEGVIKSAFINKIFAAIDKTDQPTLSDSAGRAMDLKNRLKDDVYQAYLSMLPELSVQKNFIHAKKVAGATLDMRRAFADSAFHSAYNLARMEFGPTLDAIISEAQRYSDSQKGVRNIARDRYLQELKSQHSDFSNPKDVHPVWSKITNFAFLYYLTAPASALGNLIQTPVIGIPTLAGEFDVSFARASKEIFKAFSDLKSSRKKGTAQYDLIGMLEKQAKASGSAKLKEEAEIMSELEGLTNQTQTLSLAGLAERPSSLYATGFKSILKSKSLGVLDKASMILGYGFNLAEIANRQVTALAVVRLAQSKGMNKSQTIQLAREMIRQIHFEYAKETKARFLRHPIAQVTLQFKNYAQQMTAFIAQAIKDSLPNTRELNALLLKSQDKGLSEDERYAAKREYDELTRIKKAARKRLTGVMGMTALFAGYEGLPFYYILEGVMNLIFDDEDDPYDFSLELKVAMANAFGDNVSRALSKGPMSEILQVDVSRFANLNGLWFRDDAMAKDEEEWAKNMLIDMLGPAAGIVLNVAGGIKKINEGHYARGIEEMSPPVAKDFFKAWRFYHEGATTLRGDPIVPNVGLWGVFAQSLGFTPQDLQRGYEAMGEIKSLDKQLAQREQRLLSKLFLAYKSGDYEEMDDIGEQIIRYNSKNPGNEIDDKKIKRSFAQRERMSERAEKGIIVSAKRPELLEKTVYLED
jgi:hypothetical protein